MYIYMFNQVFLTRKSFPNSTIIYIMKLLNNTIIFDAALEHAFTLQSLISTRYFVTELIIVMYVLLIICMRVSVGLPFT